VPIDLLTGTQHTSEFNCVLLLPAVDVGPLAVADCGSWVVTSRANAPLCHSAPAGLWRGNRTGRTFCLQSLLWRCK